jgi:Ca2+-binding RTX toxin-like protein
MAILNGNAQNNTLTDTSSDAESTLNGLAGDDTLYGRGGVDHLNGDAGKDKLFGEAGDDWLHGGSGADLLNGGAGSDAALYYDSVRVTVSLDGSLKATGDAVGDRFVAVENIGGSATGADILAGDSQYNRLYGLGGNDTIYGRGGDDVLNGGDGNDKLFGGAGLDDLQVGTGKDLANGGAGEDYVNYLTASGRITVSLDGSLVATGAAEGDTFVSIEDLAGTKTGNDILAGNASKNELWGDGGNDTLYGRGGNDTLYGNAGTDTVYGEAGNDIFAFKFPDDGVDRIMDFATGDKIGIRGLNFGGLAAGALGGTLFQSAQNHVAANGAVRFLFDETHHSLWYDPDGNGAAAAVQLALFVNNHLLTRAEFAVLPEL